MILLVCIFWGFSLLPMSLRPRGHNVGVYCSHFIPGTLHPGTAWWPSRMRGGGERREEAGREVDATPGNFPAGPPNPAF